MPVECDEWYVLVSLFAECPKGTFKEGYSNDPCASCPEHSFTNSAGSASCQCVEGRYRGTTEAASLPCACECVHIYSNSCMYVYLIHVCVCLY